MSTSTVEKSGLWISLSSLFRSVTSSTHKQHLSDKGRRKFIGRTVVDNEELPELPDDPEEKAVRPVVFVGHPGSGVLGALEAAAVTNCKLLLLCSAGIAAQTAAVMVLREKAHGIARGCWHTLR
jgi:hypothetical protein